MNSSLGRIVRHIQLASVISLGLGPGRAIAEAIRVPVDHPTIQGAIEAARDGDTIIVSPGTYRENINFLGKAITVQSRDPHDPRMVKATIIQAGPNGSTVTFSGGERLDTVLTGFTVATPYSITTSSCTGIYCLDSSPTVTNCTIIDQSPGFGIRCVGGAPMFTGCTIDLAMSDTRQRVTYCAKSAATFRKCTIVRGGHTGQTYGLNGTPSAGPATIVEFDPNMTNGAVYVVEGTRRGKTCAVRRPMPPDWPTYHPRWLLPNRCLPNPPRRLHPTFSDAVAPYIAPHLLDAGNRWVRPNRCLAKPRWRLHPTLSDATAPYIAPHLLRPK